MGKVAEAPAAVCENHDSFSLVVLGFRNASGIVTYRHPRRSDAPPPPVVQRRQTFFLVWKRKRVMRV